MPTRVISALIGAGISLAVVATAAYAQDNNVEGKAQMCAGCHGASGVPADPKTMPIIWGQQESYIAKQLHDYRSGDRDNAVMASIAKGLTQEDLRPMAKYFAGKQWPAHQGATPAGQAPAGLAQCAACHTANFQGALSGPRLAGLSYEYLLAQMNAFANGTRTNNQDMPKVMNMYSASDREAMARYLSQL